MSKIKLLEVPGEAFLFVLEAPSEETHSDNVPMESIIPQDQIEAFFDTDKTPELELITGELALGLRKRILQSGLDEPKEAGEKKK